MAEEEEPRGHKKEGKLMKIEINVRDYVSDAEIKGIIIDEVRGIVHKDRERILGNMAYGLVFKAVDEAIDGDTKELIRKKAVKIIDGLTEFSVFRKKDAWGAEESVAHQELQAEINRNRKIIHQKVRDAITNYDYAKELEGVCFEDVIIEALVKGLSR